MVDRPDDQELLCLHPGVSRPRALGGVSARQPFVAFGPQSLRWMRPQAVLLDHILKYGTLERNCVRLETSRLA